MLDRAAAHAERILRKFPSQSGELLRPTLDAYGQPEGVQVRVAGVEIWMEAMGRPTKWLLSNEGQQYEDQGMRWGCVLKRTAPQVRHGDLLRLADGSTYRIRNILPDGAVGRVFWQLSEV